jgi:hypothetical protein
VDALQLLAVMFYYYDHRKLYMLAALWITPAKHFQEDYTEKYSEGEKK